jgi:hypothetical protein
MGGSGSGDRLARGSHKAQFPASEKTSQNAWDAAFSDFEPGFVERAEAAEAEARKIKADRLAAEEAENERLNQERLARSAAEKAAETPETEEDEQAARFGSRFAHAQATGVSGSGSGETGSNS